MNIEYIILLFTSVSCFFKNRNVSILLLFFSIITAVFHKSIDFYGVFSIIWLYGITYIYFHCDITCKYTKIILLLIIITTIVLLSCHKLPGFHNKIIIDAGELSPLSMPFSMRLNFDKNIADIIFFMNSDLYKREKTPDRESLLVTFKSLFLCIIMVMSIGLLSGYIKFDFKIPDVCLIWGLNNLFFICLAEEVIFRGVLQNKLSQIISNKYLSIALSSFAFGLAHFKGGIIYIFIAFVAGCFYGFTYYKTKRILCAMIVHFLFNLIHFIFFTYPASIMIVS